MRFLSLISLVFVLAACNPVGPRPTQRNGPSKLLFTSTDGKLYTADASGGELKPLGTAMGSFPSWSPDGQRIVYACGGTICTINADGSGEKRILPIPNSGSLQTPSWSPDGQQIVFINSNNNQSSISVVYADGSGLIELASGFAFGYSPMFSADGQHVAFTDGRLDFATNVRIIDLGATANNQHMINAGKQEAQMCAMNDSCPDDTNPVWSPSSSQMAFVEKRDKKLNICLAGVDGGKQKCLTEGTGGGWSPAWSPDGRQIIFLSDRGGTVEIYRMDADGNNLEMIKTGLTIPACPTWSPDETKIAFTAGENGHSQVYVANADGTQPIKLTNDPIIGFTCPQWQP